MVGTLKPKCMFKRLIYLLPILAGPAAVAQDTLSTINGRLQVAPVRNPWLGTQNAAGLSVLPFASMGRTWLGASIEEGDLRRPQQPARSRQFQFLSERYQMLKNASFYGKFSFNQRWDDDIRWSAVLDPYRRNPYIVADSLGGDWKKQLYDLELKASTPVNEQRTILVGAGLQYKVGTGARQNDPRPLTYTNDVTFNPSVVWAPGKKWSVGLNGNLNFFKEKVSFQASNNEDVHYRYKLSGLGYYYRVQSISETRYYSGKTFGGSAQVQWADDNFRVLLDAGYSTREEDAQDGSTFPLLYGNFKEHQYHAMLNATLRTASHSHQWQASWKTFDGKGRDFHYGESVNRELPPLVNSEVLNNTFYNEGAFVYRMIKDAFQDDYKWMLEATILYSGIDNRYNYPKHRNTVDANEYRVRYSRNLAFSDARNFIFGLHVALRDCFTHYNDFEPIGYQTDVAVNGLVRPDQEWLMSDIFKAGLVAEYRFPVDRNAGASLYLKAEGNIRKRIKSDHLPNASRNFAAFTIGMTY